MMSYRSAREPAEPLGFRRHDESYAPTSRVAQFDLTPVQWSALARLAERGPLSQNELGRLIDMEPGNVHGLVRRLLARGLVAAEAHATDRRRVEIQLTPAGRRLYGQIVPLTLASTEETLSPLTSRQRQTLHALLVAIITSEPAMPEH